MQSAQVTERVRTQQFPITEDHKSFTHPEVSERPLSTVNDPSALCDPQDSESVTRLRNESFKSCEGHPEVSGEMFHSSAEITPDCEEFTARQDIISKWPVGP